MRAEDDKHVRNRALSDLLENGLEEEALLGLAEPARRAGREDDDG